MRLRAGAPFATIRNAYASTNVTTGAWVELEDVLTGHATELEIFDSSGQTLELGYGAAGSEQRVLIIPPGGNGRVPVNLCTGLRLAVKAISASATMGELCINLYR